MARKCVAEAFKKLWPARFSDIHQYYKSSLGDDIVNWRLFKSALQEHCSFYLDRNSAYDGCTYFTQKHSMFFHVDGFQTSRDTPFQAQSIGSLPFNDDGASLKLTLQFFTPVFIWKFNDVKRQLVELDSAIYGVLLVLFKRKEALVTMGSTVSGEVVPPTPPPSATQRLSSGTGQAVRNSNIWKKVLEQKEKEQQKKAARAQKKGLGAGRKKKKSTRYASDESDDDSTYGRDSEAKRRRSDQYQDNLGHPIASSSGAGTFIFSAGRHESNHSLAFLFTRRVWTRKRRRPAK